MEQFTYSKAFYCTSYVPLFYVAEINVKDWLTNMWWAFFEVMISLLFFLQGGKENYNNQYK